MLLGVEVELHVTHNPTQATYVTDYPVVHAHAKGEVKGYTHCLHGNFVREIDTELKGFFRVSYDATASFGRPIWHGFEISGEPATLAENTRQWEDLFSLPCMEYMTPHSPNVVGAPAHHSCGMHVHMSSDLLGRSPAGPLVLNHLSQFIESPSNADFLKLVAGRYNTRWCKIYHHNPLDLDLLFHSEDCRDLPLRKIDRQLLDEHEFDRDIDSHCCYNLSMLLDIKDGFHRGALNLVPNTNTGDIEFRLFSSPVDAKELWARLELCHALVLYCSTEQPHVDHKMFCRWLESERERRGEHRNLFRLLRGEGYVSGLIPRPKETIE